MTSLFIPNIENIIDMIKKNIFRPLPNANRNNVALLAKILLILKVLVFYQKNKIIIQLEVIITQIILLIFKKRSIQIIIIIF